MKEEMAPPLRRHHDDDDDVQMLDVPPASNASTPILIDSPPPHHDHAHCIAIESLLQSRGVRPTRQWLAACINSLVASRPGFLRLLLSQQTECCFACFLMADLNTIGAAVLPQEVCTLHSTELTGPFVLQVDEMVDIGSAMRDRYKERPANAKRCLKLSLTDGVQRVYGIEYRPIKDLKVLQRAGLKIAVHHVNVRRGLLLLVPEVLTVLGGHVEHLEAARQRVVQHISKPPRGERNTRAATFESLAESAATAAWPSSGMEALRPDDESTIQRNGPSEEPSSGWKSQTSNHNESTELSQQQGEKFSATVTVEDPTFTYLALLNEKWALNQLDTSTMQGRIKCTLTGVKEFQFRSRDNFRLVVYLDDGSQITSVMVDHLVVEALIGFTPREVSSALGNPNQNEVLAMKETLNCFQTFLTKFEGIIVLQKAHESTIPVVIEMTEGCGNSEAWALLQRLQATMSADYLEHMATIDISP